MGRPAAGKVVLVRFPFSDLSGAKVRPALVLAGAGGADFILCQVTSQPYADAGAILLEEADFASGSLRKTSYARPGKLFTASDALIHAEAGILEAAVFARVIDAVIRIFTDARDRIRKR